MSMTTLYDEQGDALDRGNPLSVESGVRDAELVTPNDGADLPKVGTGESQYPHARFLHLDATGAVRVTLAGGETITLTLTGGEWHRMQVTRVHVTGTGAGLVIHAGY